jgi:hypothetical protein
VALRAGEKIGDRRGEEIDAIEKAENKSLMFVPTEA